MSEPIIQNELEEYDDTISGFKLFFKYIVPFAMAIILLFTLADYVFSSIR